MSADIGDFDYEERQQAKLEAAMDEDDDDGTGERYGFGVCRRGNCDEPCGPNGGCVAGRRRR
jgi:hypothetical protein